MRPQLILSAAESRTVDRIAIDCLGIPSLVLMENAGRGCSDWLRQQSPTSVTILCGPGNNGGDGYVLARHLHAAEVPVQVLDCGAWGNRTTDNHVNREIVVRLGIPLWDDSRKLPPRLPADHNPFVVDALFGTGGRKDLAPSLVEALDWANGQPATRVAIDLPTGMNSDTGTFHPAVFQAAATLTLFSWKSGFCGSAGHPPVGQVHVIGLGISWAQLAPWWPGPLQTS
jgi:NAD(P)H-hydrate epimerase